MLHNEEQTQDERDSVCEFWAFYEMVLWMILAGLHRIGIVCRYTMQSLAQGPRVTRDIRDC